MTSLSVVVNASASDYVAKRKGFFKKHGLNVNISSVSNISLVPEIVGKQYDIGISTQNLLISANQKEIHVVAISCDNADWSKNPDYALLVSKKSEITSARDLVGKRVGVPTLNGSLTVALTAWFEKAGVSIKDVKLTTVNFPQMQDQLDEGRIAAAFQLGNFARLMESTKRYRDLGDPMHAVARKTMGSIRIANTKWARSHKNVIRRYELSLLDADKFIREHPKEATKIYVDVGKLSPQLAKVYKNQTYAAIETPEDLNVWVHLMKHQRELSPDSNIDIRSLIVEPLLNDSTCLPFWQRGDCSR
jgi:NitT/TauT family transport system substrate-binding protein